MSNFEMATRMKLRFETTSGPLLVEQLWDLPLQSKTGRPNLDDVARNLHRQLKNDDNVSFIEPDRKSDETVQLMFDIVKHIIDVKLKENKEALQERERKEKKQHIMELILKKKDAALAELPLEELQKMVEQL